MLGLVLQPYHLLVSLFHLHFLQQKVKSTHYMAIRKMVYGALTRDGAALPKHRSTPSRYGLVFYSLRSPAGTIYSLQRSLYDLKIAQIRVWQCVRLTQAICMLFSLATPWNRCSRWFRGYEHGSGSLRMVHEGCSLTLQLIRVIGLY